jgi:HlyD family secretion protein
MNRKSVFFIGALLLTLTLSVSFIFARSRSTRAAAAVPNTANQMLVAGPGRVEPSSEDIKLGSELSGKLRSVEVEEGTTIQRGQVLAVLENDDYRAAMLSAEAEVAARQATLRKVLNGARAQERQEAASAVRAAQAVMDNARAEMERRQKLFSAGVTSREENERYVREFDVARANHQAATERHSLVDDHAREEDRSLAEADLQLARAQLEEARAKYAKTFIRSPIDGTVLRKHHRSGESVSNSSTAPDPILTVGDKKVLRVRVDVDEVEVGQVRVGQKAYVTADAFPGQKFWGRVIRVGEQLGRKNVRTDEPTERVDTKILETLVELEQGSQLPVGLRVNAFIVAGPAQTASAGHASEDIRLGR